MTTLVAAAIIALSAVAQIAAAQTGSAPFCLQTSTGAKCRRRNRRLGPADCVSLTDPLNALDRLLLEEAVDRHDGAARAGAARRPTLKPVAEMRRTAIRSPRRRSIASRWEP